MVRHDDRGDLGAVKRDQRPDIPSLTIEYFRDRLIVTVAGLPVIGVAAIATICERCQAKGKQDSDV
jgi:hypothetical protein